MKAGSPENRTAPFTSYPQAVEFLFRLRQTGSKLGLEKIEKLARLAGNPEQTLAFIHVAGTNGKGSTCAFLESIYRTSGYRVGFFTSPHLVRFTERIQVNRVLMAELEVVESLNRLLPFFEAFPEDDPPTFFELVTVMALLHFQKARCDLVIWETGLGGRLDATNLVRPILSVITNIGLDHQKWLGETLPEIAREKAGIIKPGIPVVSGVTQSPAREVILEVAAERQSVVHEVGPGTISYSLGLPGPFQHHNAALAIKVVELLQPRFPVAPAALVRALAETRWPGRLQKISRGTQELWLDGAHNVPGFEQLFAAWPELFGDRKPVVVLGLLQDKAWEELTTQMARRVDRLILTRVDNERSTDPEVLAAVARRISGGRIEVVTKVQEALQRVEFEPLVLVTGSLYLVGEVLGILGVETSERFLNERM